MKVQNPKYEKIATIKKEYKGFCALLTNIKGTSSRPQGGTVTHYAENLASLIAETDDFVENTDIGVFSYESYTDFDGDVLSGVIHVEAVS